MMHYLYLAAFLMVAFGAFGLPPGKQRNAVIGIGCLALIPVLLIILIPLSIAVHVALGGAHP